MPGLREQLDQDANRNQAPALQTEPQGFAGQSTIQTVNHAENGICLAKLQGNNLTDV